MRNWNLYLSRLGIKPGTPEATRAAGEILDKELTNRGGK
jgi:hypothetical protein